MKVGPPSLGLQPAESLLAPARASFGQRAQAAAALSESALHSLPVTVAPAAGAAALPAPHSNPPNAPQCRHASPPVPRSPARPRPRAAAVPSLPWCAQAPALVFMPGLSSGQCDATMEAQPHPALPREPTLRAEGHGQGARGRRRARTMHHRMQMHRASLSFSQWLALAH